MRLPQLGEVVFSCTSWESAATRGNRGQGAGSGAAEAMGKLALGAATGMGPLRITSGRDCSWVTTLRWSASQAALGALTGMRRSRAPPPPADPPAPEALALNLAGGSRRRARLRGMGDFWARRGVTVDFRVGDRELRPVSPFDRDHVPPIASVHLR